MRVADETCCANVDNRAEELIKRAYEVVRRVREEILF